MWKLLDKRWESGRRKWEVEGGSRKAESGSSLLRISDFRLPYTTLSAQEELAKALGLALNTKPIPRM